MSSKLDNLTKDDIKFFENVYYDKSMSWHERMYVLSNKFNVSDRTIRNWCKKIFNTSNSVSYSEDYLKAKQRKYDKTKKNFIITWAQNNTPIHDAFFNNLIEYSKYIDANLHIIAGRYKNPTSIWSVKQDEEERWAERVKPYLDANRHNIHKYISIMSDIKIQPTAVNPMTGLQSMSGSNSCVFGSPKMQLEVIPTLEGYPKKIMVTTGACTLPNYTDSKAGKKGEFHHVYGFVIIEIKDDETFYIRQVTADDNGNFYDLNNKVYFVGEYQKIKFESHNEKVKWISRNFNAKAIELKGKTKIKKIKAIEGIVLGDLHCGQHDKELLDKTFEFMDVVKPKHVVLHDVFDGYSISHHDSKNPFLLYAKEMNNENDLSSEIKNMINILNRFKQFKNVVIVRSNHDDFLDRWLINTDWKKQHTLKNSIEYMEYSKILLDGYKNESHYFKGVIPYIINKHFDKYITLGRKDSYKILDWEVGLHGDIGSGGSRGSVQQFRKLNTKLVVGHYHSPERKDGVISVGTSTKERLGYSNGPSKATQAHFIIHENGKGQHIIFFRDKNNKIGFTNFKLK